MKNRLWKWIGDNSPALQGIAALIIIFGVLLTLPNFISNYFRPDVIVRYQILESTMPPDLGEWLSEIKSGLDSRWETKITEENEGLASAIKSPVIKKIGYGKNNIEKFIITIMNQSDNVLSDANLRINNIYKFWKADANGTFLSSSERAKLVDEMTKGYEDKGTSGNFLILSNLPVLPPNTTLELILYGEFNPHHSLTINVPGYVSDLREIRKVEDSWLIDIYQNPWRYIGVLLVLIYILVMLISFYSLYISRKSVKKAIPNTLYNTGCKLAKSGRDEEAMILLKQAVESGYSKRDHAKKDTDLKKLHDREDFEKLFSEPNDEN